MSEGRGGKKQSWWKGDGRDGLMLWLESSKRGGEVLPGIKPEINSA